MNNVNFVIDSLDKIIKDDYNNNKENNTNHNFFKTFRPKHLKNVKIFIFKFIGKKIND